MKKRSLSIVLLVAVLLSCLILPSAFAEGETATDYDALAVAEGYHFRVGTAEEAYDNGAFTGYIKGECGDKKGLAGKAQGNALKGKTVTMIQDFIVTPEDKSAFGAIGSEFTLDGNGHTLIVNRTGTNIGFGRSCTVKNLTIGNNTANGYAVLISSTVTVTFENCTLTSAQPSGGVIQVRKGGTVILGSGTTSKFYVNCRKPFDKLFFSCYNIGD